ncbi:MAG: polyprenyl synthetase family protein [Chloroherpetonaceae bacterium]|nr:polyprenyl synthetase family protein [Chloroherpetonaceae bacterium]MDW8438230.1 polyprenyl synthetase family protein [Chloroherpetonaceae bacterium]
MNETLSPTEVAKEYEKKRHAVDRALSKLFQSPPDELYAPARYILEGKGKRIRPMLALFGAEAISGSSKNAMPIALAVEVLHNFTLIHDDIMDKAALRHGRATVHTKWDIDAAILAGDVMHAVAFQLALRTKSKNLQLILSRFASSVIRVCEGQAYDKAFELRQNVSLDDYLMMISCKTGRLISASLELGGLAAGATPAQAKLLRQIGDLVGRAFQVQDDLLDIVAGEKFGKTIGGDLIEGKKTFPLLKALELAKGKERELLKSIVKNKGIDASRVMEVKAIYEQCGAIEETRKFIEADFAKAKRLAQKLPNPKGRARLIGFAELVMRREF